MDFDFEKTKRDNYYQWRARQNIIGPIESYESWKGRKKNKKSTNTQPARPKKIKANELSDVITQEIKDLIIEVEGACEEELIEIGRDTVSELQRISPKKTGEYSKSWKCRVQKNRLHNSVLTVYNSKPNLTYWLENGHLTRNGTTRTKPIPHISIANDHAQQKALKLLEEI